MNSQPRYCQMICNVNKAKRLEFVEHLLAENEQFDVSNNEFILTCITLNADLCKAQDFQNMKNVKNELIKKEKYRINQ